MKVMYSVRSHKGNVRENNEDNFFADGITIPSTLGNRPFSVAGNAITPFVLAVCDGMGGEESGELASGITARKLNELQRIVRTTGAKCYDAMVQSVINSSCAEIKSICNRSGTTLALAIVSNKGTYCYNIGDSRIYCLKNGAFSQITNDHTQGAEIAGTGIITHNLSRREKGGNKLTRCIGIGNCSDVDGYPKISGTFRLMICSDGLSDMVSDEEIKDIMSESDVTSQVAENLLQRALANGGKDNVTVIVADIQNSLFR